MNDAPVRLYGIPNCTTVRKAREALQAAGWAVAFHDFRRSGVPSDRLSAWVAAWGHERLINRQGTTWRGLAAEEQAQSADAVGAMDLMTRHVSLIRRPVIEWPDGTLFLGFKPEEWPVR